MRTQSVISDRKITPVSFAHTPRWSNKSAGLNKMRHILLTAVLLATIVLVASKIGTNVVNVLNKGGKTPLEVVNDKLDQPPGN